VTLLIRKDRTTEPFSALALTVRCDSGEFKLSERYGKKQKIGTYRSLGALECGIDRYGERMLRELRAEGY
jgi:hypothetical protein